MIVDSNDDDMIIIKRLRVKWTKRVNVSWLLVVLVFVGGDDCGVWVKQEAKQEFLQRLISGTATTFPSSK